MVNAGQGWGQHRGFCVRHFSKKFVLISFAALIVATLSYGQADTATVSGLITDQSGAVVAGAEVVVTNTDTNVSSTATSNNSGVYVLTGLKPGLYRIKVKKDGFNQIDLTDFTLNVQDDVSRNFVLRLGSMSQSISVEGRAESIETSGTVSTVIDRNFVSQLPLNGRSFNTLLQLTPGVVIAPTDVTSPGQFSINGQRSNANYFLVDGVSGNFGIGTPTFGQTNQGGAGGAQAFNAYGGTNSLVSVDAMQEFRIQTSTFAPEYGRTPGGQVMIETRSGTNQFHGELFDYFRNTVLDAADWFNNASGLPRTPEHQNDFGGTLGGPIPFAPLSHGESRTFFFFSYEGLRLLQPQTLVRFVPSQSARTSASSTAAPYVDAWPLPNGPVVPTNPLFAQFTGAWDNRITSDATSIRLDHIFSNSWTLFGRFNYAPSSLATRSPFNLAEVDTQNVDTTTITVGATGKLTQSWANSFRANYSVQKGSERASLTAFGGATAPSAGLLLPAPLSASTGYSQFIFIQGGFGGQYLFGGIYKIRENQLNLVDGLTVSRGRHTLKFGGDYRLLDFDESGIPGALSYDVRDVPNFLATSQLTDFSYGLQTTTKIRFHNLSMYGQDSWKIGQRLNLTYGVRWEVNPAPTGYDGTSLIAWSNISHPQTTALAPPGTPLWKNRYGNFAPRIGVAYQLNPSGDFVLRGGWGIFYDLGTSVVPNLATAFPNVAGNFLTSNPMGQPLTVPISNITQYAPTISLLPPYQDFAFTAFSNDLKLPRSYQWNVALEKSIGRSQAFSVTYLGQAGRDLLRQITEQQPNGNFLPFSSFSVVTNPDQSSLNSLQLQYRRLFGAGIHALLNYTYSHCIDTNSSDAAPLPPGTAVPVTVQGDRGNCNFDVRHNFTSAISYDLPHVKRAGLLPQITKDWSLEAVVQARTGFPINVTYTNFNFPSEPLGVTLRPDLVPGVPIWLAAPWAPGGRILNFSAFDSTTPANTNRQGSFGRNAIVGFGAAQMDLSVMRKFPFGERVNLQLRGDFFNILNHPNFFNPDSNLDDGPPPSSPSVGPSIFGVSSRMLSTGLGGLSPLYQIGGPRSIQMSLKLLF